MKRREIGGVGEQGVGRQPLGKRQPVEEAALGLGVLRALRHVAHARGQVVRLPEKLPAPDIEPEVLDVPVPATYGPTADEPSF